MSDKKILQLAQNFAEKKEWAEVYKICNENELENILGSEAEQIALLKIKSIINCIPLNDLYVDLTEEKEFIHNEEYDELIDLLSEEISELMIFLTGDDTKNIKHKFESFYEQICGFIKDHYLENLEYYVNTIFESTYEETKYFHGYNCLMWNAIKTYLIMGMPIDTEGCNLNNHQKSTMLVRKEKLYERAKWLIDYLCQQATDFPYFNDTDAKEVLNKFLTIQFLIRDSLPEKSNENIKIRTERLKTLVAVGCDFLNSLCVCQGERYSILVDQNQRDKIYEEIIDFSKEIQENESNYTHPEVNKEFYTTVPEKKGGCYVATAVYGSYDCPQVWTLRRYRDYTLAESWCGRAFIKIYYAISPTLVKWFGHAEWFKKMWQGKLDRMVTRLQANGIESTPYEDKEWKCKKTGDGSKS